MRNEVPTEALASLSSDDLSDSSEEDASTILAEMDALGAVFDADFSEGSVARATMLVRQALELKAEPKTMEDRLTLVAMSHCIGIPREDLIQEPPSKEGPWARQTFEVLAFGWMRWLVLKDERVLEDILSLGGEDDAAGETLSLNFWARAIELLVRGQKDESKRFFERATEVGSQFGTRSNPLICWSYAASYFPTKA